MKEIITKIATGSKKKRVLEETKFEKNRFFNMDCLPRICPELAEEIGLNQSILFLQLEFWIAVSDHKIDGKRWTYQTIGAIQKTFPFWKDPKTVRRIINSLKDRNLIFVANYNQKKYDRTPWYAINLREAAKLKSISIREGIMSEYGILEEELLIEGQDARRERQDARCEGQDATPSEGKMPPTIPEITPEITPETTAETTSRYTETDAEDFGNGINNSVDDFAVENGRDRCTEGDKEIAGIGEKIVSLPVHLSIPRPRLSVSDELVGEAIRLLATDALDAFRSVGVTSFNMTIGGTGDEPQAGKIGEYVRNVDLEAEFDRYYTLNEREMRSLILRPEGASLIQVDDCDLDTVGLLEPFAFFAEETSPKNYQVWLALPEGTSKEELDSTRRRLLQNLDKGNGGSHGSTRWIGSINCKPKHNGFRVQPILSEKGKFTSTEELQVSGLLAEVETPRTTEGTNDEKGFRYKLPDYRKCLAKAQLKYPNKESVRSEADLSFLRLCQLRGYSRDESEQALREDSERANEGGFYISNRYVGRTANKVFGTE
jgi:hypothetical protein